MEAKTRNRGHSSAADSGLANTKKKLVLFSDKSDRERKRKVNLGQDLSSFYQLSTGRTAHFKIIKPQCTLSEDWCIPEIMERGDFLMMTPACKNIEKSTRETNHGNETLAEGSIYRCTYRTISMRKRCHMQRRAEMTLSWTRFPRTPTL